MMTEVRSYNGHGEDSGHFAPPLQSGDNFLAALQDAVRENPVPAALIGMGVAWMFMGGSNVSLFGGSGRKSLFGSAAHGATQAAGMVGQAGAAVGQAGAALGSTVTRGAQAIVEPSWQVGTGAAAALGDAASDAVTRTADAASSAYQATAEMASQTAETISNAATSAASMLSDTTARWSSGAQSRLADLFERQPLMLGAIGLAIGAGMAASFPMTDTEKRMMGEASDLVREKVSETAANLTDQVKEVADAALDEAKNQGITPKTVSETLRAVGSKVSPEQSLNERTDSTGSSRGKSSRKT
jgi:hypothetical protein